MDEEVRKKLILSTSEESFQRAVEGTIVKSVLRASDPVRREFLCSLGADTLSALIREVLPVDQLKASAAEDIGPPEKKDLTIGFMPLICAVPILEAEMMGFYEKHGLNVKVSKARNWEEVGNFALNGEVDAAQMLVPMPLAFTMGLRRKPAPFVIPVIQNVNGQALTLHIKHKGVKSAADMKGFSLCVPFEYSMHNYLLRYWLAQSGIDPDKDVQITRVSPTVMVTYLQSGTVDGFLAPDPFNQHAVDNGTGFIFKLSKEIWNRHPCCSLAVSAEFAAANPNTLNALVRASIDAGQYASNFANRSKIASDIAPILNQPVKVLEEVLTGEYPDGLGAIKKVPDRIDFDPYPWQWMAVWILTQMKRWGHARSDIDFNDIAEKVFLEAVCDRSLKQMGYPTPERGVTSHDIAGKIFDAGHPDEYLKSFPISRHL
jgi:nitrate/nitrite transport system substrate-binding protein